MNLSIEQKIGRMLMVGFRGLALTQSPHLCRQLEHGLLGGVILFDYDVPRHSNERNIRSPAQLVSLTNDLQAASPFPLLTGIDQEGGRIARLSPKHGFPDTVSHKWLAGRNDLAVTRAKSQELAKTLACSGVNLNFAPCVDLDKNPLNPIIGAKDRSFSADKEKVVQQATEFIKAHHRQGVHCVLKHFPGHGSSHADSHLGMVDVTDSWSNDELYPFEKLIKAGLAEAIMTAHVFNKKLDRRYPATLSKPIIATLLRERLEFKGLVFSDDLQMRAISRHFGLRTAIELALNAGVDILLFANNSEYDPRIVDKVIQVVKELLNNGHVNEKQIDDSLLRIQRMKKQLTV